VPYNNLGVLYVRTGRFDDAIQVFRGALKNRETPYLYQNLSIAYTGKGETAKASEAYTKYLSMKTQ
jgi:pentatricopeptide repeat protein